MSTTFRESGNAVEGQTNNDSQKFWIFGTVAVVSSFAVLPLGPSANLAALALVLIAIVAAATTGSVKLSYGLVIIPLIIAFFIRFLGLAAGLTLANYLSGVKILALLGRRTLPIYLAHSAVIVLVAVGISISGFTEILGVLAAIGVIIVSIVAVFVSLMLYRLRKIGVFRYLYEPPSWFTRSYSATGSEKTANQRSSE